MIKYYRQLKDGPEAPEGTIVKMDDSTDHMYRGLGYRVGYAVQTVEQQPTWFIEVFPEFKTLVEGGVRPNVEDTEISIEEVFDNEGEWPIEDIAPRRPGTLTETVTIN